MQKERFFVTYVGILGIAAVTSLACIWTSNSESQTAHALVREGNVKIQELQSSQNLLRDKFAVDLDRENALALATLAKNDRRELQAQLAHYLSVLNRVLEIGAGRHLIVENRDHLLQARNHAEDLQKAVENFERTYGETFDPKHLSVHSSRKTVQL